MGSKPKHVLSLTSSPPRPRILHIGQVDHSTSLDKAQSLAVTPHSENLEPIAASFELLELLELLTPWGFQDPSAPSVTIENDSQMRIGAFRARMPTRRRHDTAGTRFSVRRRHV